jgi:hypothetical protein
MILKQVLVLTPYYRAYFGNKPAAGFFVRVSVCLAPENMVPIRNMILETKLLYRRRRTIF